MTINVNGKEQEVKSQITVKELLEQQEVKMLQYVSVQINDEVISIDDFESRIIKENDNIEFLYFMGGGQS